MSSSYSSQDWVLSQWAHFTVHRFICVYVFVFCVFFMPHICHIIVPRWGGPGATEASGQFLSITSNVHV